MTSPAREPPEPWPIWPWSLRPKRKRGSSSERMGILTILSPSAVMMASSPTIAGRSPLMASLTLALWRARSIGPLRCSDQSFWVSVSSGCIAASSAVEQRADVLQQLVGTHVAIPLLADQPVDDVVDAPQLVLVGRLGGGGDLDHVPQVSEELLLDALAQAIVRGIRERLRAPCQGREAD